MTGLGALNVRTLLLVLFLVAGVLAAGYAMAKSKRSRQKRPGQYLVYEVPGRTAADCRGLLGQRQPDDAFDYRLEGAPAGGWYLTLVRHRPTEQPLDTLFLLQFEGDEPARFSLAFKREAFGYQQPVMPEEMLDQFFAKKMGAVRVAAADTEG